MVVGVFWGLVGVREPCYNGRPLSYWLAQFGKNDQADAALLSLGTNCVPALLRKIQARDSRWKVKLIELADSQTIVRIEWRTALDEHMLAHDAFWHLRDRAQSAVEPLANMYLQGDPDLQERVAEALEGIGPAASAAVPVLIKGMTSPNERVRASTAEALGQIRSRPELVVMVLTKALCDPAAGVRRAAAGGLACLQTNARPAVPELVQAATDPNESVRSEVMDALRLTRGDPQIVVPVLMTALNDPSGHVRGRAALAIGAFGTNAVAAVPLLAKLVVETNTPSGQLLLGSHGGVGSEVVMIEPDSWMSAARHFAVRSLTDIHSAPEITIPVLIGALDSSNAWTRVYAAEGLGQFGTNATLAVPALTRLHRQEQSRPQSGKNQPRVLEAVGQALLRIDPAAAARVGVTTNLSAHQTG